jgi:hypothetical protein
MKTSQTSIPQEIVVAEHYFADRNMSYDLLLSLKTTSNGAVGKNYERTAAK